MNRVRPATGTFESVEHYRDVAKRKVTEPWKRPASPKARHSKLSPAKKAAAKRSAKRAGRPYPNLVDNMRAARSK